MKSTPRKPKASNCNPKNSKMGASKDVKKYKQTCFANLKKMIEERAKHQQDMKEIEERKAQYERVVNAAEVHKEEFTSNDLLGILSSTPNYAEAPPGKEVFLKDKRYQYITFENMVSTTVGNNLSLEFLRTLLQMRMLHVTRILSRSNMKKLFYLMSLDKEFLVSESCNHYLIMHCDRWIPKMKHIVNVIMNWGATFETLNMTEIDISVVYPHNLPGRSSIQQDVPDFCTFHFEHVLSYLRTAVQSSDRYSETEILLLVKILIAVSLDNGNCRMLDTMKKVGLIHICLQSIKDWNNLKVIDITKYIYNEEFSFHNQIAIAATILPTISRGNEIRSCFSFTVLGMMIKGRKYFDHPHEDEDVWELVQQIQTENVSVEDLSKLYLIVYLIHSVLCARNMISNGNAVLEKIDRHLDVLRNDVARQHATAFDANLLKARIAYCHAVWQLLSEKDNEL